MKLLSKYKKSDTLKKGDNMNKHQKNILKKQYLKKIPIGTIAEVEKYLKILKHQKEFNKKIALFKKNVVHNFHYDIYFISQMTSLKIAEVIK